VNLDILNIISDRLNENIQVSNFNFHFGRYPRKFFLSNFICDKEDKVILCSHAIDEAILKSLNILPANLLVALTNDLNPSVSAYNVHKAKCRSVFHIKLYITINRSKNINLVIGSANLTTRAFDFNYESLCSLLITENSANEVKNIACQAIKSLFILNPLVAQSITDYIPSWIALESDGNCSKHCSMIYIDNLKESLWQQIVNFADKEFINYAIAISPVYDNEGSTLTDYLNSSTISTKCISQNDFGDNSIFFHPKVYLFQSAKHTLVFIGSPNNSIHSFFSFGKEIAENGIIFKTKRIFFKNLPF